MGRDVLVPTLDGLACPAGGFVVDPEVPAALAVLTHAHADHARPGSGRVVCSEPAAAIVRHRLGPDVDVVALPYGAPLDLGDARVSLHPAGHVLGSAQVRVETGAGTWVVSGDFKRRPDPTCAPFEPLPCDVFVTEATFGLPLFRFPPTEVVIAEVLDWWADCRASGVPALLGAWPLGKAQRLLAELAPHATEPIHVHGAIEALTRLYRDRSLALAPTAPVADAEPGHAWGGALILGPPGQLRAPWSRRFRDARRALASGLVLLRGYRRQRAVDRGFVLSDHADFPDLVRTVRETGARRVLVHHGHDVAFARYLAEVEGLDAAPLAAVEA